MADCTKGEQFPSHICSLLETFLAARRENGHTSALVIIPYSTEIARSWEDLICTSPIFSKLHCYRTDTVKVTSMLLKSYGARISEKVPAIPLGPQTIPVNW